MEWVVIGYLKLSYQKLHGKSRHVGDRQNVSFEKLVAMNEIYYVFISIERGWKTGRRLSEQLWRNVGFGHVRKTSVAGMYDTTLQI